MEKVNEEKRIIKHITSSSWVGFVYTVKPFYLLIQNNVNKKFKFNATHT